MQSDSTDVSYAMSVTEIWDLFLNSEYSLIILCIQKPATHYLGVLRMLRKKHTMPIIVIAPMLSVPEKVMLFHSGANACLEQPLDLSLCVAQAYSLMQLYIDAKETNNEKESLIFGTELIINPIYRHVIIDGEPLELTRTEFDLLYYMASHPNQIFTRQQLYRQVWGNDLGISGENTVRSHIGNLYKKLADVGKNYIQNTRGVGYKFVPPAGKE